MKIFGYSLMVACLIPTVFMLVNMEWFGAFLFGLLAGLSWLTARHRYQSTKRTKITSNLMGYALMALLAAIAVWQVATENWLLVVLFGIAALALGGRIAHSENKKLTEHQEQPPA